MLLLLPYVKAIPFTDGESSLSFSLRLVILSVGVRLPSIKLLNKNRNCSTMVSSSHSIATTRDPTFGTCVLSFSLKVLDLRKRGRTHMRITSHVPKPKYACVHISCRNQGTWHMKLHCTNCRVRAEDNLIGVADGALPEDADDDDTQV